jgi:hypothetical protein
MTILRRFPGEDCRAAMRAALTDPHPARCARRPPPFRGRWEFAARHCECCWVEGADVARFVDLTLVLGRCGLGRTGLPHIQRRIVAHDAPRAPTSP